MLLQKGFETVVRRFAVACYRRSGGDAYNFLRLRCRLPAEEGWRTAIRLLWSGLLMYDVLRRLAVAAESEGTLHTPTDSCILDKVDCDCLY
jgi:hypothetical protein